MNAQLLLNLDGPVLPYSADIAGRNHAPRPPAAIMATPLHSGANMP